MLPPVKTSTSSPPSAAVMAAISRRKPMDIDLDRQRGAHLGGGQGRAAEVAADDEQILKRAVHQLGCTPGGAGVGKPVEAVAAHGPSGPKVTVG